MRLSLKNFLLGFLVLVVSNAVAQTSQIVSLECCQEGLEYVIDTSQPTPIALSEAIDIAQRQSVDAMTAKYTFLSSYWAYRSYKASRLPSLNIEGDLLNFDRSFRLLQDYNSGQLNYVDNYNLQNAVGISIKQNITLTGGTLELYSSLNRLDQFSPDRLTSYYSQPLMISYTQPIFAYNEFKWDKKIAPKEYEVAKRVYIESMERVVLQTVESFFELLESQTEFNIALSNYNNTKNLYAIAEDRLQLGSITQDELLQLQLRLLNDSLAINETLLSVKERQMRFNSLLRLKKSENVQPVLEGYIPDINISFDLVYHKAIENSSFQEDNQLQILKAESDIARSKTEGGATVAVNARFGLTQTNDNLRLAYSNLLDQEVVGIHFSIPIFDWGMRKGRVKMAQAKAEVIKNQIEQNEIDYKRGIYMLVEQFYNQRNQVLVSQKASEIADRRYKMTMDNFKRGTCSVTDLNTAQVEKDAANKAYVTSLATFWIYYYTLRQQTLYDFIKNRDIEVDFQNLVNGGL